MDDHGYCPPSIELSQYVLALRSCGKARYIEKVTLQVEGNSYVLGDPYNSTTFPLEKWVDISEVNLQFTFPDIILYLQGINAEFSAENLKNYRQMNAFVTYVAAGKVFPIKCHEVEGLNVIFLRAKVERSMMVNEEPHDAWVLIQVTGRILTAHCTCTAGLGETCSHVAALMFRCEIHVRLNCDIISPTDVLCAWKVPYNTGQKKRRSKPLHEVDLEKPKFGSPKKRKRDMKVRQCAPDSLDADMMQYLKENCPTSTFAVLHCRKPEDVITTPSTDASTASDLGNEVSPDLPPNLKEYLLATPDGTWQSWCTLFDAEVIVQIEEATRQQSSSDTWKNQRVARMTSSLFHEIVRNRASSKSLLNRLLTVGAEINTAPILWGKINEKKALLEYTTSQKNNHINFVVKSSGLWVYIQNPLLSCSPDGLVSCSCCGAGTIEIKCPHKYKAVPPSAAYGEKGFCLDKDGILLEKHQYYAQVQGQMAICNLQYCDFVCWTPKGTSVCRVRRDVDYWEALVVNLMKFFHSKLLPAVLPKSK